MSPCVNMTQFATFGWLFFGEINSRMAKLSLGELNKRSNIDIFAEKIASSSPFELDAGGEVVLGYKTKKANREFAQSIISGRDSFLSTLKRGSSIMLPVACGGTIALSALKKTGEFGSTGGPKSIGNRGDIAEGILGAAIAARFINKNQPISVVDVQQVLRKMKRGPSPGKGQVRNTIYDSENADKFVVDKVEFYLSLADANMKGLETSSNWSALNDIFQSAVKYANGQAIRKWSKMLYENNQINHIHVISDGLGGQTTTKVDVRVVVDGQPTDVNISLKAGDVKQFGQVGGSDFDKQIELWDSLLGINVKPLEKNYKTLISRKDVNGALYLTYSYARDAFNKAMADKEARKKGVVRLSSGVVYYATLREEEVTLVQLVSKEAKVYDFEKLQSALTNRSLIANIVDSAGKPKMVIQEVGTRKTLLEIRVKSENKPNGQVYIRNYVEKGAFMGELVAGYA